MKLEIYKSAEKREQTIHLTLLKDKDGGIRVVAIGEDDEVVYAGNLVVFTPQGTLRLCCDVNSDLGFRLEVGSNCIELEVDYD